MQITTDSITGKKVIFDSIIDEIPGGLSLPVTDLDYTTNNANVDKRYLPAGTPVYVDLSARTATVCKSTKALASSSAQAIRVPKNHHFKADEILNDGVTSATITSVTTTVASYDTIAVDAALIYATGTKYAEGSVTGASTALKYSPNGLTKEEVYMADGNADVSVVTIGSVREDALTYPIPSLYATALRGSSSLITIV
jgi:hypothetical protein